MTERENNATDRCAVCDEPIGEDGEHRIVNNRKFDERIINIGWAPLCKKHLDQFDSGQ